MTLTCGMAENILLLLRVRACVCIHDGPNKNTLALIHNDDEGKLGVCSTAAASALGDCFFYIFFILHPTPCVQSILACRPALSLALPVQNASLDEIASHP